MRAPALSLFTLSLCLLLGACASGPAGMSGLREQAGARAISTAQSGGTLIKDAQALAAQAKAQETYRFSPTMTTEAEAALQEAQSLQSRGRADAQVRAQALTAIAVFQKAQEQTLLARETLAASLAHMEQLNAIKARNYFPSAYQAVQQEQAAIIATLEQTAQPGSVYTRHQQLLSDMHRLEVDVIGYVKLQDIRDRVQAMGASGAEKLIPRSFNTATLALAEAEALIASTPRATAEITLRQEQAAVATSHAQVIMAMVNEVLEADKDSAEPLVLRTEQWLYAIAVALKYPDIRYMPMDEQSERYAQAIEKLVQASGGH